MWIYAECGGMPLDETFAWNCYNGEWEVGRDDFQYDMDEIYGYYYWDDYYYWGDDDEMSLAALERLERVMEMLMNGYDLMTTFEDTMQGMECNSNEDCKDMPMFTRCGWVEARTDMEDWYSDDYCMPAEMCGMVMEEMDQSTAVYCYEGRGMSAIKNTLSVISLAVIAYASM